MVRSTGMPTLSRSVMNELRADSREMSAPALMPPDAPYDQSAAYRADIRRVDDSESESSDGLKNEGLAKSLSRRVHVALARCVRRPVEASNDALAAPCVFSPRDTVSRPP